ncbi:MAG: 50S ribosomal protein L29 [Clostridiales bacterium]|nr:50S ribosomal protein L29 [Clostridiales bacterium]
MNALKLRELTTQELNEKIGELRNELFNLRFQQATGQLNNPMSIRECRKNIARVNTILRERELERAQ